MVDVWNKIIMVRERTKIGDIFQVILNNNEKKYFHYIANDILQLNSDVIIAFEKSYSVNYVPDLDIIVKDKVDFVAHCVTKLGIKMNLWEKVGNIKYENFINIHFRCSNDYGAKPGEQVHISKNWRVWNLYDSDFTKVSMLNEAQQKAEIGIVVSPIDVVTRMQTGKYEFVYPGYK